MTRPAMDVVVPFAGSDRELASLVERLAGLEVRPGDSLIVADNRPAGAPPPPRPPAVTGDDPAVRPRVIAASELRSPAHARNRGVAKGGGEWIVFFDADVDPAPDLLDRYFDPAPGGRTAVLAGAVVDGSAPAGAREPLVLRYARLTRDMGQENTLSRGHWRFAQTANCAVRRTAFEAVGGFCSQARAGEDADLCFRLRAAGWELERRDGARGVHRGRATLGPFLAQRVNHGSGAAWLERHHPGSFPARRRPGLAWWAVRRLAWGAGALARRRRDDALLGLIDPLAVWAFELGRLRSNRARPGLPR